MTPVKTSVRRGPVLGSSRGITDTVVRVRPGPQSGRRGPGDTLTKGRRSR